MARRCSLRLIQSDTDRQVRKAMNVGKTLYKGFMTVGPSVGQSFSFFRDDGLAMHTSIVRNVFIVRKNLLHITTLNSIYRLFIGKEVEPR